MQDLVIVGAGGHARVLAEIVQLTDEYQLVGFTDRDPHGKEKENLPRPVLGSDDILPLLLSEGVKCAVLGVGAVGVNELTKSLFQMIAHLGFLQPALVHPSAYVCPTAELGRGSVVMAKAVISTNARLGNNVTVNSGGIIEHDSVIGNHVHVATGAFLGGGVIVGPESHIGIGTSVVQGKKIGHGSLIGAGSVVVHDIPDHVTAFGVPARIVRKDPE